MSLNNSRGQSLIEYLIIVAIVGVSSMGVIRLVQHSLQGRFAYVAKTLQADKTTEIKFDRIKKSHYQRKDFGNFMDGTIDRSKK